MFQVEILGCWPCRLHLIRPRRFGMNFDGFGGRCLFLDDILGFDRKRFGELEESFCAIFPEIEST